MNHYSRRKFMADVGRGMLVAGVGSAVAADVGVSLAGTDDIPTSLTFGELEPLVAFMEETPIERLQPLVVKKLRSGTCDLRQLVAAASLANARKFGGENYVGFHTIMALAPAYQLARELPTDRQPLPVLKVLYRNTDNIQKNGGRDPEVLHPVAPIDLPDDRVGGELLRDSVRARDVDRAEGTFAALSQGSPKDAYEHLQYIVHDDADVHRVVLAHRAFSLLDFVGANQAHTMLRESVRYCVDSEKNRIAKERPEPEIRAVLPKLLDEYHLIGKPLGGRVADDAWVRQMSETIYRSSEAQAAEAVAAALSEGFSPEAIGEAMSLAANMLQLRDRSDRTHGASRGVHASDSANAWRNIARVSDSRGTVASIIVGAYHICEAGALSEEPYPLTEHLDALATEDPARLMRIAEEAIRENDQQRVCAAVQRYGELGQSEGPVFSLLRRFAISEDGRLHGEKYYVTVKEEFATTRPSLRWRHLVGLARATASGYSYTIDDEPGYRAPGYEEACRLLDVEV
jgi:hypothetical protein